MRKIIFYISIALLLFSCKEEKPLNQQVDYFSVFISFDNDDELEYAFGTLQNAIKDTLILGENNILKIGLYDSYRIACDKGFELYADKLIKSFEVEYKGTVLKNDYNPFYFVGNDLGRPALYKTDILKVKPELVWSRWGREIMTLHRSGNRQNFFFTASLTEDIRGNFPLVMDGRLYRFGRTSEKVSFLKFFGRGINLSAGWENDTSFSAYFTILDSMFTSTIIQNKYTYNVKGEFIDSSQHKYDLVKDGIQIPTFLQINPISPNLRYKISTVDHDSTTSLNVIDELNGTNNFVVEVDGQLKANDWNRTSDYLFAKFANENKPDTTDLFIVNLKTMKLAKHFSGSGSKNYIIIGNLLIFDDGFGADSFITLFRYRKNEIFSEIRIPGGCGVENLPAFRFYQ